MHSYRFTSTVEDLLEAEEAERSAFIRRPFRWAILALALLWAAVGLVALLRQPSWQPMVWLCLGLGVLYYLGVRPHQRRSQIRNNNAAQQDVILEFADDRLNLGISGVGQFTRQWDELSGITVTDEGILFYFSDGIKNWLPNRVFASDGEKGDLVKFLKAHEPSRHEGA